jgi:hypothetical protein
LTTASITSRGFFPLRSGLAATAFSGTAAVLLAERITDSTEK